MKNNKKTLTTIANLKRRQKAVCSLSLILILTATIMMAFSQPGLAQVGVPQPEKTVGYISVAPKVLGVGQTATVNLWVLPLPTTYNYVGYFKGFSGITVTFVKPDGTKDTFKPVDGTGMYAPGQTEATGSLYFFYAPDKPGNWSVSFTMPEQNVTDASGTVIYAACTSNTAYFTVLPEPVNAGLLNGWPWSPLPLPSVYWSYPISSNNREWSQISGEWLGGGFGTAIYGGTRTRWQSYGPGPNTGHTVWKQPLSAGGLIGGDYGSLSYYTAGLRFARVPIMEGRVFINIPNTNNFECIDLRTGEIYYKAAGQITVGLHLPGNPAAQASYDPSVRLESSYGSYITPVLFGHSGTTWNFYDPFTGTLKMSFYNYTGGSPATFSTYQLVDGTTLAYGTTSKYLYFWNLSKITATSTILTLTGVITNDWSKGIEWTRPLPVPISARSPSFFGISSDLSTIVVYNYHQYWGYSAKDGTLLWNFTLTYPVATNEEVDLYGVDRFIVYDPTEVTFHCYSMLNGTLLWTSPSFKDSPWASTWTVYQSETNDHDKLYLAFPDGIIRALSLKTGKLVWETTPIPSTEYTNNVVPFVYACLTLVGGNLYAYAGYSLGYQINPIPRFSRLVCVNATTGNITWILNGAVLPLAAAYGYVIGWGIFDGNLYCIGKGPTKTTVEAPLTAIPLGESIVIKGSVMDMSLAAQDYASKVRFPNGVPAVADEDMSEWMDYLYMQNATLLNNPPNPRGVSVRLTAVYPNGSVQDIGTVTTDSSGIFKKMWTPETEGEYMIYATFEGSESYWPSYGATAIGVTEAPVQPEAPQAPAYNTIDLVIIAAVAVVAVLVVYTIYAVRKLARK